MTDATENSSLPLLLSITGAVLAVAVGGWFFLDQEPPVPTPAQDAPPRVAAVRMETNTDEAPLETPETAAVGEAEAAIAAQPIDEGDSDIDAELSKARLAADADILVFPPTQSAIHYYSRVLEADPDHAIAMAELDATLAKVSQIVTTHLNAEEYDDAYTIAGLVAKIRPEHALVVETQQTLDARTEQLVEQAIQNAQNGNDEQADQDLASAENLPGRNPEYFVAIRESIAEIRSVRQAAARDKAQRARMAANEARKAWGDSVRNAIEQGKLIAPAGASARDLLAENNRWTSDRAGLTGELLDAMMVKTQSHIDDQRLEEAETLLNVAVELSDEPDRFADLRSSLERAYIERKSNRIAQMTELVRLKAVAPRYPRRAERFDMSGWVDVLFTVTPNGQTADITIRQSEPESVFDRAAVDAVAEWEFQPVEYRGQVISQRAGARLVFRLE